MAMAVSVTRASTVSFELIKEAKDTKYNENNSQRHGKRKRQKKNNRRINTTTHTTL